MTFDGIETVERSGMTPFATLPAKVIGMTRYEDLFLVACEDGSFWAVDRDGLVSEMMPQ